MDKAEKEWGKSLSLLFFSFLENTNKINYGQEKGIWGQVCIFLMIADVEYIFMWLLTIYLSSLGKYLKATINKMKRQLIEWENLFENDILKGVNIQNTHTKNMQLNVKKKTKNSIKKWAEDLNRNFSILKKDLLKYSFSFWTNIYLKIAVNPYSPFVWDWIKFYWILCIC